MKKYVKRKKICTKIWIRISYYELLGALHSKVFRASYICTSFPALRMRDIVSYDSYPEPCIRNFAFWASYSELPIRNLAFWAFVSKTSNSKPRIRTVILGSSTGDCNCNSANKKHPVKLGIKSLWNRLASRQAAVDIRRGWHSVTENSTKWSPYSNVSSEQFSSDYIDWVVRTRVVSTDSIEFDGLACSVNSMSSFDLSDGFDGFVRCVHSMI